MKRILIISLLAALMAPVCLSAQTAPAANPQVVAVGEDWQITRDETIKGVRYITAVPSAKVCSKLIEVEIKAKTHVILHCKYTRGCPGNAIGLCALLEGMTVEEAIKRLDGTPCGNRGTSCPDQLARVLKSLKW